MYLKRKEKQWDIINAYLYNYIMCIFINIDFYIKRIFKFVLCIIYIIYTMFQNFKFYINFPSSLSCLFLICKVPILF